MKYASVYYRDYADNSLFTPGAGENNGELYLCLLYTSPSPRD